MYDWYRNRIEIKKQLKRYGIETVTEK